MARLFVPGPTDVAPQILEAQAHPMIAHRSQACEDLIARIQPRLRQVLQSQHRVLITASTGSGMQEAALRNTVARRALLCINGAFAERWHQIALANNVPADRLDVEWDEPVFPDPVEAALREGSYDALAIVHNETSTGVENPLAEIVSRTRSFFPDILLLVDAVSSAGGVELRTSEWGIDVLFTSSQKCFALPPGLAFAAVSDRALERARGVPHRGWYFDFLLLDEYLQRNTTPATPALSLLYALDAQLDRILDEGLAARFERHSRLATQAQTWADERFALFAPAGYRSKTVTAVLKPSSLDVDRLNRFLGQDGMSIAGGYGKLRDTTFRIGHMGEIQPTDLEFLLARIDAFLEGEGA
ncbi:MAG TPA: alanine--glyoxylate aminotransferase family protein [Anaerolineales bacterium]|nr:alanine--glyoxylate aminotransferase family protein [Anaerolineales bacterium]